MDDLGSVATLVEPHRPRYVYCGYPDTCCGHHDAVGVECAVCQTNWPCATKRAHHTPGQVARLVRWAEGRGSRPPCTCTHHRSQHRWARGDHFGCNVEGCACRAHWIE